MQVAAWRLLVAAEVQAAAKVQVAAWRPLVAAPLLQIFADVETPLYHSRSPGPVDPGIVWIAGALVQ